MRRKFSAVPIRLATLFLLLVLFTARASAAVVLLLSTGNPTLDTQTQTVLQNAGHTVTVGSPYTTFTSAELAGINVVLLFPSANWSAGDMPLASQTALVNFVQAGGGLVASEWTNWKVAANNSFSTLSTILPVTASSQYTGGASLTYTKADGDAVLDAGLPSSFTFTTDNFSGVESYFTAKSGAQTYFTSSGGAGGAGVVGWTNGSGRVLQLSTVAGPNELANASYALLLQNSVNWTAQAVPEPSTIALLGAGLALCGWSLRRRR